mmetsp:Transcript_11123/g.24074  ORF Transcript_11123/g.24074 Transcript_11123/m.24074 type:complete len:363 (+) Transcript_11123:110-1198(+)
MPFRHCGRVCSPWPGVHQQCRRSSHSIGSGSNNKRSRPLVHLSSAPGSKYGGKEIGSPYPIIPHDTSPINYVKDRSIDVPWYARRSISPDDYRYEATAIAALPPEGPNPNHDSARAVGRLAREAMDVALSTMRPGITTDDINAHVFDFIVSRGAYPSLLLYRGFPKSICTSINEVMYLGVPDMRPIEIGDVVSVAIGCYKHGLHAKVCDTVVVQGLDPYETCSTTTLEDSRDERTHRLVQATREALEEAVAVCQAGVKISEIGRTIQSVADRYDYRIVKDWNGHGIGREFECLPQVKHLRNDDTTVLQPDMMLTIEPILVEGHAAHVKWSNGHTVCSVDGGMAAQSGLSLLILDGGAEVVSR